MIHILLSDLYQYYVPMIVRRYDINMSILEIILESPSFQTNFLQIKPSASSEEIMDTTQFQWTIVTGWWFERPPQPEKYDFVN